MTAGGVQRLPLFPLGSVLFPGLLLPLQIFEPRYVALVRHLQSLPDGVPAQFGVITIREGGEVGRDGVRAVYDIGCVAVVRQVEDLPPGRFALTALGAERFRLHGFDDTAGTPYITGLVTPVAESEGTDAPALAQIVATRFEQYRALLGRAVPSGGTNLARRPWVLSYLVASSMVLDLPERQSLLTAGDTSARLRREMALLRRENIMVERLRALPAQEFGRIAFSPN